MISRAVAISGPRQTAETDEKLLPSPGGDGGGGGVVPLRLWFGVSLYYPLPPPSWRAWRCCERAAGAAASAGQLRRMRSLLGAASRSWRQKAPHSKRRQHSLLSAAEARWRRSASRAGAVVFCGFEFGVVEQDHHRCFCANYHFL